MTSSSPDQSHTQVRPSSSFATRVALDPEMRALNELVDRSIVRRASETPRESGIDADQADSDLSRPDPQHEPLGVDDPNGTNLGGRGDLLARCAALGCGMATCHDPRHEQRTEWPGEMERSHRPSSIRDSPGCGQRVSGGTVLPAADASISVARRRSRVSSFLAIMTQRIAA